MNRKLSFLNKPLVCLTSYNKFTAEIADEFCDVILVGDSLGMAYYGDENTRKVSMEDMIRHGASVRKGVKKAMMIVDMPYGSYQNTKQALKNAKLIVKKTSCDAIKLEGGSNIIKIISLLVKNNINVIGHIGLMPQTIKKTKNYRVKGKNVYEKNKIINDFIQIQKAGVAAVVLEAVKLEVANEILKISKIPVIGIGASNKCHGQIIVMEDILGYFVKVPKFAKKYADIRSYIKKTIKKYSLDIKHKKFPTKKNLY